LLFADNLEEARINALQSFELVRDQASKKLRTQLSIETQGLVEDLRSKVFEKGGDIYEGN
jgi:hypothetical protein